MIAQFTAHQFSKCARILGMKSKSHSEFSQELQRFLRPTTKKSEINESFKNFSAYHH